MYVNVLPITAWSGIDSCAKKLVAKSLPAAPDRSLAAEAEYPGGVQEILRRHATQRPATEPSESK